MRGIAYLIGLLWCVSCVEYTPKPRGYVRIEPSEARYVDFSDTLLPCRFHVSQEAVVKLSGERGEATSLNLSYPELGACLYCGYLPIDRSTFGQIETESRAFVARQIPERGKISEKAYSNPDERVYGSLFALDGESATPVQFWLTDSVSHFFRGALYFDCKPNADSLAPAIQYVRKDIIELIQTFSWRN